ncbi:hypothetical protein C8A05DRAFT_19657, partial [Staphylotrichum tortipilum]
MESFGPMSLVCSSLRQRPAWASTATHLLQSDGRRWRETHLGGTHDIALSIPTPHSETYQPLRLLLLSSSDLTTPDTLARIQHLHSTDPNAMLLFLLDQTTITTNPHQTALQSFMNLNITY